LECTDCFAREIAKDGIDLAFVKIPLLQLELDVHALRIPEQLFDRR
jgi:hypothetical protein